MPNMEDECVKKVIVKCSEDIEIWSGYIDHFCDRESLEVDEVFNEISEVGYYKIGQFYVTLM